MSGSRALTRPATPVSYTHLLTMSLVESAVARLGKDPPGFVGSIGTVFSESAQRAAFEITSARGVTLVAKAHLSRESYDRELIGWLTARQCGLSAPLFWYPYFKAEPPYVLTYALSLIHI